MFVCVCVCVLEDFAKGIVRDSFICQCLFYSLRQKVVYFVFASSNVALFIGMFSVYFLREQNTAVSRTNPGGKHRDREYYRWHRYCTDKHLCAKCVLGITILPHCTSPAAAQGRVMVCAPYSLYLFMLSRSQVSRRPMTLL